MRKLSLVLAVLLVIPWLAGCPGAPNIITVNLGDQFSLRPGQSASIKGEDLTVRFAEVVGDSRCPAGVTCFWAGEVSCLLEITHAGRTDTKTLVEPGAGPAQTDFAGYRIAFDVQPYPRAGEKIDKGDYRLTLTFSKGPA